MASRLPLRLQTRIIIESLWCQSPPSFLAPVLASSSHLHFSTSSSLGQTVAQLKKKKRVHRDAYALRQIQARKEANLSRQAVLKKERVIEAGDPIRGVRTAFVESFDAEIPQEVKQDSKDVSIEAVEANPATPPPSPAYASKESHLDHGLKHEELTKSFEFSRSLTEPLSSPSSNPTDPTDPTDPDQEAQAFERWKKRDATATEAVQRIVSLTNASSKQRTRKNIERIIDTFGRHNTDQILRPKAPAVVKDNPRVPPSVATPRAGPDTGSSEVQIGILTAKIKVLADRYEGPNRNDKVNKRNLRLLLHRRQKLLAYMERKERGSDRWQRMISTLGLTPACWKGEIAVE